MADEPRVDPRTELAGKRTTLASFRTGLALDRTTLAWIRTTLTMGSFGFGMIGFFRTIEDRARAPEAAQLHHAAVRIGELLVLLGIVATVLAGAAHRNTLRRLDRGDQLMTSRWPLSITIALFVAILGVAGLWRLTVSK
jgi:uncharacterized membrane protein YidH (DUF202 family)